MPHDLNSIDEVEDSLAVYLGRLGRPVSWIYLLTVALLVMGLAALPLVRVSVTLQADGVIRPVLERHEVIAPASGRIEQVAVQVGDRVAPGETLIELEAAPVDERIRLLEVQLVEVEQRLRDTKRLLDHPQGAELAFAPGTRLYREQQRLLRDEVAALDVRLQETESSLERARSLVGSGFLASVELEADEFERDRLVAEREMVARRYRSQWEGDVVRLEAERLDLRGRITLLEAERASLSVRAPARGSVEEIAPISAGSHVQAGRPLVVISPDAELVAEVYVDPRRFGLIEPGTHVRILVDAFRYSDWGVLTGRVAQLPGDYVSVGESPVFRMIVHLDGTALSLRNGARREVSKGMTIRARFLVAERSLWQLLRDDLNDWFNPLQRPA